MDRLIAGSTFDGYLVRLYQLVAIPRTRGGPFEGSVALASCAEATNVGGALPATGGIPIAEGTVTRPFEPQPENSFAKHNPEWILPFQSALTPSR